MRTFHEQLQQYRMTAEVHLVRQVSVCSLDTISLIEQRTALLKESAELIKERIALTQELLSLDGGTAEAGDKSVLA